MEDHSKKQEIKKSILNLWPGLEQRFKSETLVWSVKFHIGGEYIYPDTILRYMRQLKAEGKLNYVCQNRRNRVYFKKQL